MDKNEKNMKYKNNADEILANNIADTDMKEAIRRLCIDIQTISRRQDHLYTQQWFNYDDIRNIRKGIKNRLIMVSAFIIILFLIVFIAGR